MCKVGYVEHVTWFHLPTLPISLSFWSSCTSARNLFEEGLDEVRDDVLLNVDGQIPDHKIKCDTEETIGHRRNNCTAFKVLFGPSMFPMFHTKFVFDLFELPLIAWCKMVDALIVPVVSRFQLNYRVRPIKWIKPLAS